VISDIFIAWPRLAFVVSVVMVLAGLIALTRIPVAQYPDIVPPQVTATTTFPGASATTVEASVAEPIEAQVNGVDKAIYMSSTSGNDGSYTLTVSFTVGSDPNINAVNVQNRVNLAQAQLPAEVNQQGLTIRQRSSALLQVVEFYSPNRSRDSLFLNNYVTINVLDTIARVPGVGQAQLFANLSYSMRIWLDTDRLTGFSLVRTQPLEHDIQKRDREYAERSRRDHAAEHRGANAAPGQRGDAGREDKRREAQHEGQAGHQYRPDAHARPRDRRLFDRSAARVLIHGESDDQNRILAGERDENDNADLGEEIVAEATEPQRDQLLT
jgi:hypothetical protein